MMHIIAPFDTRDAVSLTALARYWNPETNDETKLWSSEPVHEDFKRYGIHLIKPYSGLFPSSGRLIVVGAATRIGHWFDNVNFDDITLLHLQVEQQQFFKTMHQLTAGGLRKVAIEYGSEPIKRLIGLEGKVIELNNQLAALK